MPIYEYRCTSCAAEFERLVRVAAESPGACPRCGAPDPARVLSVFATQGGAAEPSEPGCSSEGGGGCACGAGGCGCR